MAKSNRGKTIAQLSVLIQSGVLAPVALAEETFTAIRANEDQSIFVSLLEERALQEASASSKRIREGRSLGLLDGIPVAWKDLFDIEGIATTAGSAILKTAEPATRDADVVKALTGAGMVSIGRVNMSGFRPFSGLGINPHYGTPENPASKDGARLPGGSSSGSGVVVAAGLVPVSIGSDTGGSVRIPAAFNGIVGYKATRGRYSMRGVLSSVEKVSIRSVRCAARCTTPYGSMRRCAVWARLIFAVARLRACRWSSPKPSCSTMRKRASS